MGKYILIFFIGLVTSILTTPLAKRLAFRFGILDLPNSQVKTHHQPIPYLGGLAIYFSFMTAIVVAIFLGLPFGQISGILIGCSIIMFLGLVDDLRSLHFKSKIIVEVLVAFILILFDIRIKFVSPDYIAYLFTILWVVGITNALNIIDIMDGLASGVSVIAALAFLFISLPIEASYVNYAASALAGATLGFLKYNFPPAKIFMGDTGSLMLGFVLAALAMGTSYTQMNNIALFSPLLILGIPIYDTSLVIFLRYRQGKSIFQGSLDHFALRLQAMGYNKRKVIFLTYVVSISLSGAALVITKVRLLWAIIIYIVIALFSVGIGIKLSKIDMEKTGINA